MANEQPAQIDVIPVNGWIMELGEGLNSPHIHQVTGLNKKTGTIEVIDGGTNRKFFFSDGILEHAPLNIVRSRDGSEADAVFSSFFDDVVANGRKLDGQLIQFRNGQEIYHINFVGVLMNEYSVADLDTHGTDKADQTYVAQADWWQEEFL